MGSWFHICTEIYVSILRRACFDPRNAKIEKKISFATPWILLHFEFWYHVCNVHWPDSVIHLYRIELRSCMVQCMMVTFWHSTAQHSIAPWLVSHSMYRIHIMQWCYFCWLCNILSAQIQTQFSTHGMKIKCIFYDNTLSNKTAKLLMAGGHLVYLLFYNHEIQGVRAHLYTAIFSIIG